MSPEQDRALFAARRFCRASDRKIADSDRLLRQGRIARVLAASKPGGMLLNVDAPELSFFLAEGMDITSQLVSVMTEAKTHAALKASLRDDIRVSVHSQHPVEFLSDIRDHRFDLMIFQALDPAEAELATASLAPGGLMALFAADGGGGHEQMLSECGMITTDSMDNGIIAARSPQHLKPRRRGGRRKRPPFQG